VLYAFGIVGMAIVLHLSLLQAGTAALVFLPGDLVKAVVAALVARGVHQALPGLLPQGSLAEREPVRV